MTTLTGPTGTGTTGTDITAPSSPTVESDHNDLSPRNAALIAGVGYILLFALGLFANFFVREALIVTDDPAATAANLVESEGLFRLGMVSFLAIFLIDVVIAWALYVVFRKANRDVSLLAAWFRLVYTMLLGVALAFFFQAMQLLGGAEFLSSVDTGLVQAQAQVALDTFNSAWLIGLAGFGVHLMLLGYLIISSGQGPRVLGYVLAIAGLAYVVDTTAHALLGNYSDYATIFLTMVAIPSVIGESWFGLWLLLRGGRRSA